MTHGTITFYKSFFVKNFHFSSKIPKVPKISLRFWWKTIFFENRYVFKIKMMFFCQKLQFFFEIFENTKNFGSFLMKIDNFWKSMFSRLKWWFFCQKLPFFIENSENTKNFGSFLKIDISWKIDVFKIKMMIFIFVFRGTWFTWISVYTPPEIARKDMSKSAQLEVLNNLKYCSILAQHLTKQFY